MDLGPEEVDISSEKLESRELLGLLHPETVVDQEENPRIIFTFQTKEGKPVKAIFYSPGELPVPKIETRQMYLFGDKPDHRPANEWEEFIRQLKRGSDLAIVSSETSRLFGGRLPSDLNIQGKDELFLVEASPAHLLDFVSSLGVGGFELNDLQEGFIKKQFGPAATKFMDRIIAGKIINDNGSFQTNPTYEGEALVILALLGNDQAERLLEERVRKLQEFDQAREDQIAALAQKQKEHPEAKLIPREGLKPEELLVVHLTNYLPQQENGSLEISSKFDATGWSLPHNTIHVTLNHPVKRHLFGSWEGVPYAILAPFNKLNELNGNPVMLSTVDTIYELSPGTTLKLPPETVTVRPFDFPRPPPGILWQIEGQEVFYKDNDFTPEDIRGFVEKVLGDDESKRLFNEKVCRWMEGYLRTHHDQPFSPGDLDSLVRVLGGSKEAIDILQALEEKPIEDVIEEILTQAGLADKSPETIKKELVSLIESLFTTKIKTNVIKRKIEAMSYPIFAGGPQPWSDYSTYGESLILAAKMGIPVTTHEHHITGETEAALSTFLGYQIDPKKRRELEVQYHESYSTLRERFAKKLLPEISAKSRRMAYLMGII